MTLDPVRDGWATRRGMQGKVSEEGTSKDMARGPRTYPRGRAAGPQWAGVCGLYRGLRCV